MATSIITRIDKSASSTTNVLPFARRTALASPDQQEIIDLLAAELARAQRGEIGGVMLITSTSINGDDHIDIRGLFSHRLERASCALTKSLDALMAHILGGGTDFADLGKTGRS
ncbi:hypothetical protein FB547_10911 [Variovorax beijingensis]|uniref:Uncharacterized protein n=1 Tax=Variovorax beijingensis TaxID=2496117 RepID=A0A561BF53_9BURK|nr:hypothetical protein [Variovorax beijingensis]TWD77477.1 hypothetical protein FB547_10911 [Variovorax beijingensis]